MKTLLVYANGVSEGYFPVGLATLSSYLRGAGHDVSLFDTSFYVSGRITDRMAREKYLEFKKVDEELLKKNKSPLDIDFRKKVEEFNPDIIGVSTTSTEYEFIMPYIREIKKEFDIPLVVGGVHPTVTPNQVIIDNSVDMICIGEGEEAMTELCDKMQEKADITNIRNIWVKKEGKIYKNPVRPLIQDLDSLPFPDWDLFDDRHFKRPYKGDMRKYGYFALSRGCPYSCTYCINEYLRNLNKGSKYFRRKSIDSVIEEINAFKKNKELDHVQFTDECFLTMPKEDLEKLSEYYAKNVGASFYVQTRPESLTQEKINVLKQGGNFGIGMGIESGNDRIRKEICNRNLSKKQIINTFDLLKKNNINSSAFNIIGFPEEGRKEIFDTIKLNKRIKPTSLALRFLDPFDGTVIKEMCEERGYKIKTSKEKGMYYEEPIVTMPQISEKELKGLRKTFILYTYLPRASWPIIKLAEKDNIFSSKLYDILSKIYRKYYEC